MRVLAARTVLIAGALVALTAPPAAAGHLLNHDEGGNQGGGPDTEIGEGTVTVTAGFRDEISIVDVPTTSGTYRPIGCMYFVVVDYDPWVLEITLDAAHSIYGNEVVGIHCWYTDGGDPDINGYPRVWHPPTVQPPPPPPLIELPELQGWATNQIAFAVPTPELSPAGDQVVGIETWLAVTSQLSYAPLSAQAGPIWVTATPVFSHVTWDMGNGDTVVCADDVDLTWSEDGAQSSGCSYVYESNGDGIEADVDITATAAWDVFHVTSSNGASTYFGTVTTSTVITVPVRELQAVID